MTVIQNLKLIQNVIDSKKLLIFDFDGVLADSVEVKTEAFALLYKPYGQKVVEKVVSHHRDNGGMSRFEKFKLYHQEFIGYSLSDEEINDLSKKFSKYVINKIILSDEIPGAESFLDFCCSRNKICVVNSATPEEEMHQIIDKRGYNKYFSAVYGSPKSKVENIARALTLFNVSASESLFFGDAESDLSASKKTGLEFVGVGEFIKKILTNKKSKNFHLSSFQNITNNF